MRFEGIATNKAEGAILAHSLKAAGLRSRKGRILDNDDVAAMCEAGVESAIVAGVDPGDVPEDVVAERPRSAMEGEPTVEIVLLAAGRASRMGANHGHKLLATFDGEPLVRRMARTALASKGGAVHAVLGYREDAIRDALAGLEVDIVANPHFMDGMAGSLKAGLSRVSPDTNGMLVLLADMPRLTPRHLDALVAAFVESGGRAVVRAAHDGQRGNPVVVPRSAFEAIDALSGDRGARAIVESGEFEVVDVEIGDAAHVDVDTPEAVAAAGGKLERPEQAGWRLR